MTTPNAAAAASANLVPENLVATAQGTIVRIFDSELFWNARLPDCKHILTVKDIPDSLFVEVQNTQCSTCGSKDENWICLVCHKLFCSHFIQGHMGAHYSDTGHAVSISLSDLSIWCEACAKYVDYDCFPLLQKLFTKLHTLKFGEQPVDAHKLQRLPESDPVEGGRNHFTSRLLQYKADCAHLDDIVHKPPTITSGWLESPCEGCGNTVENWICLKCLRVFCGRFVEKHMLKHHNETGHGVCLSLVDMSIWCYTCTQYLDHAVNTKLHNIFDFFHTLKFGVPAPTLTAFEDEDPALFSWSLPRSPTPAQITDN